MCRRSAGRRCAAIETELKGETMTGVLALVSPAFFDKLIGHAKVEEAYKYFSSTGAQPLREDTRRRFPFAGIVFEEYNATVTLSTGATETLVPAGEGIAFPLGTMDTFVTYGAPANLIETVNTVGLPIYARQIARPDGSAIDVKTEASVLPVNKRPRLAVQNPHQQLSRMMRRLRGGDRRPLRRSAHRARAAVGAREASAMASPSASSRGGRTASPSSGRHGLLSRPPSSTCASPRSPSLAAGDTLDLDGETFVVQGSPGATRPGSCWTAEARPAG